MPVFVAILNIGPFELILIAGAAVLLFGGDLPQAARQAARFVGKLRGMASELTRELTPPPELDRPSKLARPPELDLRNLDRPDPVAPRADRAAQADVVEENPADDPESDVADEADGTKSGEPGA